MTDKPNKQKYGYNADAKKHIGDNDQRQRGYTAQAAEPLDPSKLEPPIGDTAVQPPKRPASEEE